MNAGVQPLVITIVLCLSVTNGNCRVIYVTPERGHSCPHNTQLCYTLSHIAENTMNYFSSNTRIIFLPGNHTTNTNRSMIIANVSNITLEGSGSTIQCIKDIQLGFVFIEITNLSIRNLHLYQCGAVLPSEVRLAALSELSDHNKHFYTKSSPALYLIQVTNITISRVSIHNSTGPGLLGFNVIGHSTISQSSFVRNNLNCVLLFMDNTLFTPVVQSIQLSILDSEFLFGKFVHDHKIDTESYSIAAGLSAIIRNISCVVSLNFNNVTACANNGIEYGNLFFFIIYCDKNSVEIQLHKINCSHSNYTGLVFQKGNGLITRPTQCKKHHHCGMNIQQSYFGQNAYAVYIRNWIMAGKANGVVFLVDTIFHSNSLALTLERSYAILISTSFTHNTVEEDAPIQIQNSIIKFLRGTDTFLRNRGETAGAIYAHESKFYFEGNVRFVENEGYDGGAIAFHEQSQMLLKYSMIKLKVNFTRNHARHYGGAIYVDKIKTISQLQCFYSLDKRRSILNKTGVIISTNNTSDVAGSALYGGWVGVCHIRPIDKIVPGYRYFKSLFEINRHFRSLTSVL